MGFLKMFLEFILELFFDQKEEYQFTSVKFNIKRVAVFVLFVLSCAFNLFMVFSYVGLGHKYIDLQQQSLEAKNKPKTSSDSQNTPKN